MGQTKCCIMESSVKSGSFLQFCSILVHKEVRFFRSWLGLQTLEPFALPPTLIVGVPTEQLSKAPQPPASSCSRRHFVDTTLHCRHLGLPGCQPRQASNQRRAFSKTFTSTRLLKAPAFGNLSGAD